MSKKLIARIILIALFVVGILAGFIVNFIASNFKIFNIADLIVLIVVAGLYFLVEKFWRE